METTGVTVSCNRKQFTVTDGNCSWELLFFQYLKLAPETLLRKKSVNWASDENVQLGQDGLTDPSLLNSVQFLSSRLKIVSCCYDEMHTEQSDVTVYSCFIMHRYMNTCILGPLSLFGDWLLSSWSQLIDKSHISESSMLCLKPLDTLLSTL